MPSLVRTSLGGCRGRSRRGARNGEALWAIGKPKRRGRKPEGKFGGGMDWNQKIPRGRESSMMSKCRGPCGRSKTVCGHALRL
jgi:hypothetical protein